MGFPWCQHSHFFFPAYRHSQLAPSCKWRWIEAGVAKLLVPSTFSVMGMRVISFNSTLQRGEVH